VDSGALDAEGIVDQAVRLVERCYAFPSRAADIAGAVRDRLARGEFRGITVDRDFCRSLTRLFQALSNDKHMGFAYFDKPQPMRDEANYVFGALDEEDYQEGRFRNCGFHAVRRLDGNVGLIDLRSFCPVDIGGPTATAAMNLVADTEALIIDLRSNDGGRQDMAAHIASYLFDEPTRLSSRYNYITGELTEYWTSPEAEGRRFGSRPLFLVIGAETFSAAECFAYDMKHLGRATLVGERTAGGANPTKIYTLTPHVWVAIPYGYHINPITGTDWEGVGVPPDIEIGSAEALNEAHRLALLGIRSTLNRKWPGRLLEEFSSEVDAALRRLSNDS
jgi:hypothetical protein